MREAVYKHDVEAMLLDIGGCDANDPEAKGWDSAIDAALDGLRKVKAADRCLLEGTPIQCKDCKWHGADGPMACDVTDKQDFCSLAESVRQNSLSRKKELQNPRTASDGTVSWE